MKKYKICILVFLILFVIGLVFYYLVNINRDQNIFYNRVVITNKINITDLEKIQVIKSVDEFMKKYKLPKGIQNSYAISIEKKLNESIEIIINPGEEGDIGNLIIYVRKTNNVWQVDPNGGPWCTLEEFDQKTCF